MNSRVTTRWQHNRVTLNHNNFLQNETKSHRFVAANVLTEKIPFPHKDPGDSPQIMKIGVFTRNVITSPPSPTPRRTRGPGNASHVFNVKQSEIQKIKILKCPSSE